MKFIRFSLFGILICSSTTFGNPFSEAQTQFEIAEENFQATLFHKARDLYRQLLEAIEVQGKFEELLAPLCCRLGQVHYFLEDFYSARTYFERAEEYFKKIGSNFQGLREQSSYYYALTSRHLKDYPQAIKQLKKHLKTPCQTTYEEALFELALNTFLDKELLSAKEQFQLIFDGCKKPQLRMLAQLYLTRLDLAENDFITASKRLNDFQVQNDPLGYEIAYLQGEITFRLEKFKVAIELFEKALPKSNPEQARWFPETLYNLGWCHLKMAVSFNECSECTDLHHFEKAEAYFKQLIQTFPDERIYLAMAQCYLAKGKYLKDPEAYIQARKILANSFYFRSLEAKIQALLLSIEVIAPKLAEALSEASDLLEGGLFSEACLKRLALSYLHREHYKDAEEAFLFLAKSYPDSPFAGEALYWGIHCSEKLGRESSLIQCAKRYLFESYPDSPFAASAYFTYYSYRQYLQGDRAAIKHLQAFKQKFPNVPLQIIAYYLMGLDYKRERKSAQGRSIRKKNDLKAIKYFFKAETLFDKLHFQQKLPQDHINYYAMIRYRALLERALSNQAIADDSLGAKRAIYLQYAQELFIQINREMIDPYHSSASLLTREQSFPKIHQESLYYLVKSYIKCKNTKGAHRAIEQILAKYESLGISTGYYLSCIHIKKGMLAMRQGDYDLALKCFLQAEQSNQGNFLSVNQKLDLWIQQSLCYKALYQTDHAMLILSKVINDNTVSSLRVKAMFLRSEIYALQGRHELARKQLEATAKKGGEWALKAKEKLEQEYGIQ